MQDDDTDDSGGVEARIAGLRAFNQLRKQGSREKLLAAAIKLFCRDGYTSVSIEEITAEAGVSRITYYRHFSTKAAVALELFNQAAAEGTPRMLAIGLLDYRDRPTVVHWLTEFFSADRDVAGVLRVLSQANVDEADFSKQVQPLIAELIDKLGRMIPAFHVDHDSSAGPHQWVQAWLLIYTILDQSNHAATRSGIACNPLMIEVLTDSFLSFVNGYEAA